jgi:hypothetical protein
MTAGLRSHPQKLSANPTKARRVWYRAGAEVPLAPELAVVRGRELREEGMG